MFALRFVFVLLCIGRGHSFVEPVLLHVVARASSDQQAAIRQSVSGEKKLLSAKDRKHRTHLPAAVDPWVRQAAANQASRASASTAARTRSSSSHSIITSTVKGLGIWKALSPLTIGLILVHVAGGALAAPVVLDATKGKSGWYRKIDLPSWTPPDRVFPPIWTTLYACMGVAVARVIKRSPSPGPNWLIPLWFGHYLLNLSWAPIFFGAKRLRFGLMINCLLVGSLATIIPLFAANNSVSGWLLLPYMAWLLYATALNFAICKARNPTRNGGVKTTTPPLDYDI